MRVRQGPARTAVAAALLFAGACRAPSAPPSPPAPPPAAPGSIAERFRASTTAVETVPALDPEAAWRYLLSTLASLRASAGARADEILVQFEPDRFHATRASGPRRTFLLPSSLRLAEGAPLLLLRADLTLGAYAPRGTEPLPGEEVTVVSAKMPAPGGLSREFRLAIKGDGSFRTIETAG